MTGKLAPYPVLLALGACSCAALTGRPAQADNLHLVKRIYVSGGAAVEQRLNPSVRKDLAALGFDVVDEAQQADAILKCEIYEVVVVDAPAPDPPEWPYKATLTYPSGQRAWATKFTLRSRLPEAQVDAEAAQKIAGEFLKAQQASAKKAKSRS